MNTPTHPNSSNPNAANAANNPLYFSVLHRNAREVVVRNCTTRKEFTFSWENAYKIFEDAGSHFLFKLTDYAVDCIQKGIVRI